jgi:PAS domain S-box-containing protein
MSANRDGAEQRGEQVDLRDLIETLPALVLCVLPDGSVEFANRAFHEYTGWSLQEPTGGECHSFIHSDDRPDFVHQWSAKLASGTAFETQARLRRSDGQFRWFAIKKALAVSLTQNGGPSLRALIACEDIDDRKREEFARRYSDERYRVVVETASDAIISMDENGTIQFTNPATERIFGHKSQDLIGKSLTILMPECLREAHENGFKRYLRTGEKHMNWQGTELTGLRKNGQKFPVEVSFGELTKDGRRIFTGLIRDISERKRAEEAQQALQMTQIELERVSRLTTMGELAASIAHEVNQPLAAIANNGNACLRLLAHNNLQPEILRRALEEIVADTTRASAVIARIRALIKKTPSEKSKVNINEIIHDVMTLTGRQLQQNRVLLEHKLVTDLPLVMADRVQLQQVLLNLVMNGIEAMTGAEHNHRLLRIESGLDKRGNIVVAVRDSGFGLGSEADQLFTPFFTTKANGMGMGLSISRTIIEAHGGRLWAEANVPSGAVFSFTLPLVDGSSS